MAHRPSPLSFDSGRQSPFKRQNSSASPATARGTPPPQTSPLKSSLNGSSTNLSPTKPGSLSPEKTNPFARRPSQISQTSERPSSPFGRPTSGLGVPASPSRQTSSASKHEEITPTSARGTPAPEDDEDDYDKITARPSPSPFDGPTDPPSAPAPSRSMLRPTANRNTTGSPTSTIKPPNFNPGPKLTSPSKPALGSGGGGGGSAYKNVPQPLLRSMREAFEVLDSNNSGSVNSASVASMLEQMGMENHNAALLNFFPPNAPSQLNLARYLDTLSGPLGDLSAPDELMAAFSAFDVDDSGQIDVAELRKALLMTAPEPGEEDFRLSEREIDSILGEFSGRRAFGAKGTNVAKGKGEVFRYREFMGAIVGGPGEGGQEGVVA